MSAQGLDHRVFVTGIGAITPNGLDWASTWEAVVAGRSGIATIRGFDAEPCRVRIAGEVRDLDAVAHLGRKVARRADRNVQLALVAAEEAVRAAGLDGPGGAADAGVFIASGAGGIETYVREQRALDRRGPRGLSPLLIPMIVIDSASVQVATRFGARGPSLGIATACSSSLDATGLALETIRRGDAELMLAGGTEAAVNMLGIGGFDRMGALSTRNDDPTRASRPFDSARDGFVLSEGSVVLVLESEAHARARGAPLLAEVTGYASNTDPGQLTAPVTDGAGAALCLERTLAKANARREDVDLVCAHATSTPLGDLAEAAAIRRVFGPDRAIQPWVSAPKSATGHLLGAAGALAIALACNAIRTGTAPPTINLDEPDSETPLRHVANVAADLSPRCVLVPSYGFGGHNSAVLVREAVP